MNLNGEEQVALLQAELAALKERLRLLEEPSGSSRRRPAARWRPSKKALLASAALTAVLLPAGLLYGQKAIDALFIDKDGKVGIGTTTPGATLDVNGTAKVNGTLNVAGKATLADLEVRGALGGPKTNLQVLGDAKGASEVLSLKNVSTGYDANKGAYLSIYAGNRDGNGGNEMARVLGANKDGGHMSNGYMTLSTRTGDALTEKVRIDDKSMRVAAAGGLAVDKDLTVGGSVSAAGGLTVTPGDLGRAALPIRFRREGSGRVDSKVRGKFHIGLDPYCSDADGCRIRMALETWNTLKPFKQFTLNVAVSSGDVASTNRRLFMIDEFGNQRACQVGQKDNCEISWPDDLVKVRAWVDGSGLEFDVYPRTTITVTVYDN